jgi:hypothetical protein
MMVEATEQEVPATVEAMEEPQQKAEGEKQPQVDEKEDPEAAAAAAAPEPEEPPANPFSDAGRSVVLSRKWSLTSCTLWVCQLCV